ncbi:DUF4188 domain-containing protein [Dictyobacter formicarum]|uniref:Transcriptional regulator n=1 Tax=Dictyobacter formicarum TaxID=2778368 RepID=A0ABQ3VTE8_9CHLR|nr:DUF4188 domain-containing protein [Dictyobacter formicarum]GHO89225.1 transcriptional regulator [Dictyobacter formicarum]
MATVIPGRFTAQADQPFVVFLIGMRINKFLALRKWIPTALAMRPMMSHLYEYPESGFLGAESYFNMRGAVLIQYWRSFEDLERFARSKEEPHLRAWQRFNKAIGTDGSVGIWHETYMVEAGKYEAVYGNMPVFGLAAATQHVPAVGRRETARRRLGGESEPAVATPAQPLADVHP